MCSCCGIACCAFTPRIAALLNTSLGVPISVVLSPLTHYLFSFCDARQAEWEETEKKKLDARVVHEYAEGEGGEDEEEKKKKEKEKSNWKSKDVPVDDDDD